MEWKESLLVVEKKKFVRRAYEKVHRRTAEEQRVYDQHMATYRRHMMERGPVDRVPSSVSQDVRPVVLSNEVDCSRVTPHTVTDECRGRR